MVGTLSHDPSTVIWNFTLIHPSVLPQISKRALTARFLDPDLNLRPRPKNSVQLTLSQIYKKENQTQFVSSFVQRWL
ncbi:uncharacterized protein LY89DRAFT_136989 [Mollisia scopiformis]|uniref:Uncharacterized protein n=1 Tax=Mollisia scopiformis TaxID=149040 RepID=A0A194X3H2_MOLSC|nr:uncharacterized protein LY89DRAFT_136989 [Mollisia scopiformis]KUJ14372.1 hypothetical protein LY89DRAFT_136989 [Mollisia scopiformis]